jgi:hypothetical protein
VLPESEQKVRVWQASEIEAGQEVVPKPDIEFAPSDVTSRLQHPAPGVHMHEVHLVSEACQRIRELINRDDAADRLERHRDEEGDHHGRRLR